MTPERFQQIRRMYEEALTVDAADRDAFLRRACEGDADLLADVRRLLVAHESTGGRIQTPLVIGTAPERVPKMEGRRIGAYEIVREVGRGGMGIVFLASRVDGEYTQRVAIKIMWPGLEGAGDFRRFKEERQILATLEHPHIARLLDGGTTDEGQPYLVMEFVDGQPLDSWCNERRLNVTRRLELFRSVCHAVQYAHQQLIVHLDLKPSNILVTPDGVVKLLDFGIARLLQPLAAATVTVRTRMTPEYASPEQISGQPVGVASDVYSLGVVLYDLLTGHRPYRMDRRLLHEIARVICEDEPVEPSTIVTETEFPVDSDGPSPAITPEGVSRVRDETPARLKRRLQGDLDNILMTALRKEPGRRYASVERFDEDLERHLTGLPVRARPNTIAYRVQKFVWRNPVGTATGVSVIATLAAGLGTTLWQERLALRGQAQDVLLPQVALYTYVDATLFVLTAYVTRARFRRVAGALTGAAAFVGVGYVLARTMQTAGWWQFGITTTPRLPTSLFVMDVLLFAATLALVSWRITRRLGWRGQVGFVAFFAVWGPARDYLGAAMTQLIVISAGLVPAAAWATSWVCAVTAMQLAMRVVAGSATADRLARSDHPAGRLPTVSSPW